MQRDQACAGHRSTQISNLLRRSGLRDLITCWLSAASKRHLAEHTSQAEPAPTGLRRVHLGSGGHRASATHEQRSKCDPPTRRTPGGHPGVPGYRKPSSWHTCRARRSQHLRPRHVHQRSIFVCFGDLAAHAGGLPQASGEPVCSSYQLCCAGFSKPAAACRACPAPRPAAARGPCGMTESHPG